MTPRYLRHRPTRSDNTRAALVSAALGASIGIVAFYLTRLFSARESIGRDRVTLEDYPADPGR